MNPSLLADLQSRHAYPSVTILANTIPGTPLSDTEVGTIAAMISDADRRMRGDVDDQVRVDVVDALHVELARHARDRSSKALVLCASQEHAALVRLGRTVTERVVVDHTFATRELVADLNRTATFAVFTISDQRIRFLIGDRHRLVERRDDLWPLERTDDHSGALWKGEVAAAIEHQLSARNLPVVVAGVKRTVGALVDLATLGGSNDVEVITTLAGNHDRTPPSNLHTSAWPAVVDWLRADAQRAQARLDQARSAKRFAGGIDELWPLAREGRIELLAVEEGYHVPARIDGDTITRAEDREAPDVVDDVVDELIEHVMRAGGSTVMLPDGRLEAHDRIAATLRF